MEYQRFVSRGSTAPSVSNTVANNKRTPRTVRSRSVRGPPVRNYRDEWSHTAGSVICRCAGFVANHGRARIAVSCLLSANTGNATAAKNAADATNAADPTNATNASVARARQSQIFITVSVGGLRPPQIPASVLPSLVSGLRSSVGGLGYSVFCRWLAVIGLGSLIFRIRSFAFGLWPPACRPSVFGLWCSVICLLSSAIGL